MTERGLNCGFPGVTFIDQILANPNLGTAEITFTAEERVVGWSFTPAKGKKQTLIHPLYKDVNY